MGSEVMGRWEHWKPDYNEDNGVLREDITASEEGVWYTGPG